MNTYRIDVNIVSTHSILVEGVAEIINRSESVRVSRSFPSHEACRRTFIDRRPDVLLLDVALPDGNGLDFCREMLDRYPRLRIIAITPHSEYAVIQRMLNCGVHGYLHYDVSVNALMDAIRHVYQGECYLSPDVEDILKHGSSTEVRITEMERNILELICEGYTNPEIAARLYLGTETVNWYRKRLLAKFNVKNTVCLVTLALREKLL